MGKVLAAYGGGFKPPTKGHLEVVKRALAAHPEIDEFIIYVGGKERNGIGQTEAILIWDMYKKYLPMKVKIEPSKLPIKDVLSLGKNNPDDTVYFVIGGREGRQDDLDDIADRTKNVEKAYSNMKVKVQTTPDEGMSGTNARKAAKISSDKLSPYLPDELTDKEKEEVFNIIRPVVNERKDPKKGTGKKPKGSSRRLYTDEDPKDTVGIKFSTRQDIVDTLNKASFKAKSHARQSQIINLIHQRVRAAYGRAKDPKVKKRLKTGLDYITNKKEASKKKTQRLKKQKNENVAFNHNGKAAPFGSGYDKVKERKGFGGRSRYRAIEKRGDKFYYIQDNPFSPGIRQEFGPYKTKEQAKKKMNSFPPSTNYRDINEGKYDSLVTKLAGFTLNAWKGDFKDGQNKGYFEVEVGPGREFDYPHLTFNYSAKSNFGDFYKIGGLARPRMKMPEVKIEYWLDAEELPRMWEQISMSLRNTIRHEIEHLMQSGPNVKKGKEMGDDSREREELKTGKKPWWKIWRKTLGTPDYYKLEKEIDANLQGLYFKAKKLRQPLEKVIDIYLQYTLNLPVEDREDIKALWKERAPKLNIPLEEGDTYEKMAAKGKKAGNLKQGTVRKRLGIPKDKKIPLTKINKELSRLKKMDKDKDKKGVQLGDKNQKYYKALQLSKTLKTTTNLKEDISKSQLDAIEKYADGLFNKLGIDIEFTKHFLERVNDKRNIKPITTAELIGMFKRLYKKHGKPLSKLDDDLTAVVKDFNNNINIPFAINVTDDDIEMYAKTVMRKKDFKTSTPVIALQEGRYDQEVLLQSRFIMNIFKSEIGKKFEGDFEGQLEDVYYDLELLFTPQTFDILGPTPFIVNAAADGDSMTIQIDYNPDAFPQAYNELNAEIKDALRHELEHVGQFNFDKGVKGGDNSDDLPLFDYLTLDYEIPAFVQGLYKKAKTRKITLDQAIDEFLDERVEELSFNESKKIKQIWTNWAKENLPKAQINENATYSKKIDLVQYLASLTQHMLDKGMNIEPLPALEFIDGDSENASDFFGKTAYYDPNTQTIVLYTEGRHPKDIARSYTHEMIHHIQNLENRLGNITTTNTTEDDDLNKIEAEANLKGTMTFRNWTDSLSEEYKHKFGFNDKLGKDPFGLNQFAREIAEGVLMSEEEVVSSPPMEYKIFSDMDGVITDFNNRYKKYAGMMPAEYEKKFGKDKFWELADAEGVAFWVGMPWMDDGKKYWDYIKDYDVELLSSPSRSETSRLGKRLWVRK